MEKPRKQSGLWMDLLPVDKFQRVNDLPVVTNPIYLERNSFTRDGVLSNEIFGVSSADRRNRFAIIDLHGHYMTPPAAIKLSSYDRKTADCLYSRKRFRLTKEGELVEDPEGNSGPEYLYQIWGRIKVREKTTETTKIVQEFFEQPRDEVFITKFPVLPAFYRDINTSEFSQSKGSSILNSQYSNIISYTRSMAEYTDDLGSMTRLTQARVQTLMVEIYQKLMVETVKGKPSKFGMLRRAMAGKNLPYTSRLVITAPNLNRSSLDQTQVRFGYATIPIQYVCSEFMPFMVHELKNFFDAQFIQGGKAPVMRKGKVEYVTFTESFDENQITGMLKKFINSPNTRFDLVLSPPDESGECHPMIITGRFNKENTTFTREATYTDILYIVACRVVENKHVYVTRYPLDNPNGQCPYRIIVATTTRTTPVTIGDKVYEFYPVIEGDPLNVFMSTMQFSNTMIGPMNADFDGDQTSVKPTFTVEANRDAERFISSNAYVLNIAGKNMREFTKDFVLTQYELSRTDPSMVTADCNRVPPKYAV